MMDVKAIFKNRKDLNGNSSNNGRSLTNNIILKSIELNLWYRDNQALKNINLEVLKNSVTAIIGPSGCGKSTLIRCFNRMNDVIEGCSISGKIWFHDENLYEKKTNVIDVRKRIGMIFQKPNPFPMTIYDNITYGPRVQGVEETEKLDEIVGSSLKRAFLWEEVKDRLKDSAMSLSGGQQQRLCIARALAIDPEILLMDEPTASLDPIATAKIEELVFELKKSMTIVCVTHNMQQAARISDYTCFMYLGELIEYGETTQIFENPQKILTENYITGRFG